MQNSALVASLRFCPGFSILRGGPYKDWQDEPQRRDRRREEISSQLANNFADCSTELADERIWRGSVDVSQRFGDRQKKSQPSAQAGEPAWRSIQRHKTELPIQMNGRYALSRCREVSALMSQLAQPFTDCGHQRLG